MSRPGRPSRQSARCLGTTARESLTKSLVHSAVAEGETESRNPFVGTPFERLRTPFDTLTANGSERDAETGLGAPQVGWAQAREPR